MSRGLKELREGHVCLCKGRQKRQAQFGLSEDLAGRQGGAEGLRGLLSRMQDDITGDQSGNSGHTGVIIVIMSEY